MQELIKARKELLMLSEKKIFYLLIVHSMHLSDIKGS